MWLALLRGSKRLPGTSAGITMAQRVHSDVLTQIIQRSIIKLCYYRTADTHRT
jgi:hypothetical protein